MQDTMKVPASAADNIVICPPRMVEKEPIERIVTVVADAIRKNA